MHGKWGVAHGLSSGLQDLWGSLSRTKAFDVPRSASPPRPYIPVRDSWKNFGAQTLRFMYKGLGVTAPLAVFYVVGVVSEEIGGQGTAASLFLSVGASLLTGLWYSELISADPKCSGQLSGVFYQLVGEFPAFCVGVLHLMAMSATTAALAKALSATMDSIVKRRIGTFLEENLGLLPISAVSPDLAAGAVVATSTAMLIGGLQHSGVLKVAMNALSILAYLAFMAFGAAGVKTQQPPQTQHPESNFRQVLSGSAVCCVLFRQFLDLGRRSKGEKKPRRMLPLGVALTCLVTFSAVFSLGILISLMLKARLISGAPLLQAFTDRQVEKPQIFIASLQVAVLGLGVGVSGEDTARQLVTMAQEGFLPPGLAMENASFYSHSRALLLAGLCTALVAVLFSHAFVLQFLSANVVLINVIISLSVLYRPYRCQVGSLCRAPLSSASKRERPTPSSFLKSHSTASHQTKVQRTLLSLKSGLRFPSMGSEEGGSPKKSPPCAMTLSLSSLQKLPLEQNSESESSDAESEVGAGGFCIEKPDAADSSSDTDVDAVVSEFKEKLKVSSKSRFMMAPTRSSARGALLTLVVLCVAIECFCILMVNLFDGSVSFYQAGVFCAFVLSLACVVLLTLLSRFPQSRKKLRIPCSPWISALTLFFNMALATEALRRTMWAVLPVYFASIVWYGVYAINHSKAAQLLETQRRQQEQLNISPFVPSTVFTMQQKAESHPKESEREESRPVKEANDPKVHLKI